MSPPTPASADLSMTRDLACAARLLRRLGYTEVERYGSTGLSAMHGRWRWHFYSVAVVKREAAKARTVRRIGH